ncbi:MAG: Bax inhibitor-1 family protein [Bacteroidia bacterium]|nr:Bax inhibitor-1 family protein [Bacteroidia bacterium]NNJ55713.1 permease [Bacteroidia bacterium]
MENIQSSYNLSQASNYERVAFYRKTYLHVALAFLVFLVLEVIFLNTPAIVSVGLKMTQGWTWLIVLGAFMLVTNFAEKWARNAQNKRTQYIGFGVYILAEAFIFVPLLFMAKYYGGGDAMLQQAFLVTLFLFIALSAVVFLTKKDFSFLRSAIAVGSIVAIGIIIAGIAFGFDLGLVFSGFMVLLAAASILYQTSNLVHHYTSGQYVAAALGLFASFMLMLWYIIQFFMGRD